MRKVFLTRISRMTRIFCLPVRNLIRVIGEIRVKTGPLSIKVF